jgi:hypothetical protein
MNLLRLLLIFAGFVGATEAAEPYLTINGQKVFQLGWYTRSAQSNSSKDYIDEPAANSLDFILPYDIWSSGTAYAVSVLNYAQSKGIKVLLHGTWTSDPSVLAARINAVKNHAALYGYYLYDEPELDGTTPAQLLERYNAIKTLDSNPNHPIIVTFTSMLIQDKGDRIAPYLPATDIQAVDCYMVHADEAELQPNLATITVETKLGVARGQTAGKNGFIIVPPFCKGGAGRGYRIPTYKEMRYLCFAPVTVGAGGVLPWIFGTWGSAPPDQFSSTAAERAASANPVFAELQGVEPYLIQDSTGLGVSSLAGNQLVSGTYGSSYGLRKVTYTLRGSSSEAVLIATNNTTGTLNNVDFHVVGINSSARKITVLNEQRTIELNNGVFYDTFEGPYSVHVYKISAPLVCGDTGTVYVDADLNKDCYVSLADFCAIAKQWQECTDPANPDCN